MTKAIPSLSGKLTSSAIRIPTPNASLAILNITTEKATNLEEVNEMVRNAALE